jgi:hypothetical protein
MLQDLQLNVRKQSENGDKLSSKLLEHAYCVSMKETPSGSLMTAQIGGWGPTTGDEGHRTVSTRIHPQSDKQ